MSKSISWLGARFRRRIPRLQALPEGVWKRTGALNTWGTNAIEGNTLTHEDVERLLLEGASVAGRPTSDVRETLQHEEAFRGLLGRRKKPIDLACALELHEEVFRGQPAKRPGQWRVSNVYIAGNTFRPPRREEVIPRMEEWQQEVAVRMASTKGNVLTDAAWMHHRFERIHPFEDGNGRAGRLLLNLFLLKKGWPPLHVLPGDRRRYLDALEAGNKGDLGPLARFMETALARSILDLLDQVGGPDDALVDLRDLAAKPWVGHKADYLALRCRQGVIPAIRAGETSGRMATNRGRPRWLTSEAALRWALGK
jgi:Fic family protein